MHRDGEGVEILWHANLREPVQRVILPDREGEFTVSRLDEESFEAAASIWLSLPQNELPERVV